MQQQRKTSILETDSLELVSLRKNRDKYRSEVTAIIRDIEEMLSTMPPAKIIHTWRSTNFAAHLCAQHASSCSQSFAWSLSPSFLLQCLQSDCNNSIWVMKLWFTKKKMNMKREAKVTVVIMVSSITSNIWNWRIKVPFASLKKQAKTLFRLICRERKTLFLLKNKQKNTDYKTSEQGLIIHI